MPSSLDGLAGADAVVSPVAGSTATVPLLKGTTSEAPFRESDPVSAAFQAGDWGHFWSDVSPLIAGRPRSSAQPVRPATASGGFSTTFFDSTASARQSMPLLRVPRKSLPEETAGEETIGLPGDTGVVKRSLPVFRSKQKSRPPSLPT